MKCRAQTVFPRGLRFPVPLDKGNGGSGDEIAHFMSQEAHAQAEVQSAKSFLALCNQPKLVLQTLGKLAIRLQALDRKLNVPRTFAHFRSDQAQT